MFIKLAHFPASLNEHVMFVARQPLGEVDMNCVLESSSVVIKKQAMREVLELFNSPKPLVWCV